MERSPAAMLDVERRRSGDEERGGRRRRGALERESRDENGERDEKCAGQRVRLEPLAEHQRGDERGRQGRRDGRVERWRERARCELEGKHDRVDEDEVGRERGRELIG